MSVHKDINGKESSKRLWARRLLTLGYLLAIFFVLMWTIAFFFFEKEIVFPTFLRDIWLGLMASGTGVIFGTVFEKPKKESIEQPPIIPEVD